MVIDPGVDEADGFSIGEGLVSAFFGQCNAGIEPRATNFSGLMHAPGKTTTPASIAQSVKLTTASDSWTQYQGHWGQQELVAKFGIAVPGTKEEQGKPEGLVIKNAWKRPADALSSYTRWTPACSWSEFSFRAGECTVITNN